MEDTALAARVRSGDPDAWAQVCRAASPRLRASARRHGLDDHEADDVVSEVFARAIAAIARYRPEKPIVAWLHGIERNVLREHARRHAPQLAGLDPTVECSTDDPAAAAVRALDAALAVAALRTLDERSRLIVYLRVCEGRSADEVALLVSASAAAVRMAQSRAMRQLRAALPAAG